MGFIDFDNGDFCTELSNNTAINSNGQMMIKTGDNMAMNLETGELHVVSGWTDNSSDSFEDEDV